MAVFAFGLNHHTAPVEVRERAAIGAEQLPEALGDVVEQANVSEAVILSTCNRTEVYITGGEDNGARLDWLNRRRPPGTPDLRPHLFCVREADAVRQLLRVACSLDSMILGEPQILGQLKQAYHIAQHTGTVGPVLHRLFQYSFNVAKAVRSSTAIGENPVSVAFATVRLAQQIFGDLHRQSALLIGAGETIELTAQHLAEHGVRQLIVANRTFARSQYLAERYGGFAASLDAVAQHLAEVDIVISATASPRPLIDKQTMAQALIERKHRPVFLLDIAVPRDIEPAVAELEDAYLYTVDDLNSIIEDGQRSRRLAAEQAQDIVEHHVDAFMAWLRSLEALPTLLALRRGAESARDELLARAEAQLARGADPAEVLKRLADSLTRRLTHAPSVRLKEAAARQDAELLDAARRLFDSEER